MQGVELFRQPLAIAAARHRHDIGGADNLGFAGQAADGEDGHDDLVHMCKMKSPSVMARECGPPRLAPRLSCNWFDISS